jgi:hypothetical protein
MAQLRKAAATLGVTDVVVTNKSDGNGIEILVTDVKDSTANVFSVDTDTTSCCSDQFKFVFNIGNFKFVGGDYEITISNKLISHFKNLNAPIEYWVALEKNSTFGG